MFRSAASTLARKTTRRLASRLPSACAPRVDYFHVSLKRDDDAAANNKAVTDVAPSSSSWDPMYFVPLGIILAVPAINYEWYLVNEETQLLGCFVAFTMLVYNNFGGTIKDFLEEDGKRTVVEHNKVEDEILGILGDKLSDIKLQANVVQDAQDVLDLKVATYEKLNTAGKIKPLYEFKSQVERLLNALITEEALLVDKAKHALLLEATAFVTKEFAVSKDLKTSSLNDAISQLKGTKSVQDPVKAAYLKFFQDKAKAAAKADETAESRASREAIVTKLNAIAMNENFFFRFDESGKPKLVV